MLEWNIIFGIRLKKIWKKIKGDFKIKVYLSDGKFEICNSKTSENEVIFFIIIVHTIYCRHFRKEI